MASSKQAPWAALPPAALHCMQQHDHGGNTSVGKAIPLVCKTWSEGSAQAAQPHMATGAVNNDHLPPLPAWARATLHTVQLRCSSAAVPVGDEPADHFGPGDAEELKHFLQRLQLSMVNEGSSSAEHQQRNRVLRLVMGSLVVQEAALGKALRACAGVLEALPRIEIVCEPVVATSDKLEMLLHKWFNPEYISRSLPAARCLLDGDLAQQLTVCQLSTGLHTGVSTNTSYPHLHTLGLCLDRAVVNSLAATSNAAQHQPVPVEVPEWNRLLSSSTLPSIRSLCLHTQGHVVTLPPGCLCSLTTLQHLVITGCGIKITSRSEDTGSGAGIPSSQATPASIEQAIAGMTQLQSLRCDAFCKNSPRLGGVKEGQPLEVNALATHSRLIDLCLGVDLAQLPLGPGTPSLPPARLQRLLLCLLRSLPQPATQTDVQAAASSDGRPQPSQQQAELFEPCLQGVLGGLLSVRDLVLHAVSHPIPAAPLLPLNVRSSVQRIQLAGLGVHVTTAQPDSTTPGSTAGTCSASQAENPTADPHQPSGDSVQLRLPAGDVERQLARSTSEQLCGPIATRTTLCFAPGSDAPAPADPTGQDTQSPVTHVQLLANQYLTALAGTCPQLQQLAVDCVWCGHLGAQEQLQLIHLSEAIRSPVKTPSDLRHIFSQLPDAGGSRLQLAAAAADLAPAGDGNEVWGLRSGDVVLAQVEISSQSGSSAPSTSWDAWSWQQHGVCFRRKA